MKSQHPEVGKSFIPKIKESFIHRGKILPSATLPQTSEETPCKQGNLNGWKLPP